MIHLQFRLFNERFAGSDLLLAICILGCCMSLVGCQTAAPAGAENPQWQKFSAQRPSAPKMQSKQALVVHVNHIDQLVTISRGVTLPQDFLLAYSPALDLKAVLMMQPMRNNQLRTALILDGTVAINDQIVAASDADREKFLKKFPNKLQTK